MVTRQNAPGDAGWLVCELNSQQVVVQRLSRRLEPGIEPVTLSALWLDQYDPGRLNEQHAEVAISSFRYAAEDGAVAGTSPSQAAK
jgi:hypothetical protein